jgi:hypothetical protein
MKMREIFKIKINEEFKPVPQFKKLYYIYLILAIPIAILTWYIPILFFAPLIITLSISILILVILIFIIYWVSKYYDSIFYKLTEDEIIWKRGVWFKKTGIVPYNRITNIDILQGPISRMLRIASLKIQTAGYSAPSHGYGGLAEIKINGIEEFENLRELIMRNIRGRKPIAVETYAEENINLKILNEVIKIRELLEKGSQK